MGGLVSAIIRTAMPENARHLRRSFSIPSTAEHADHAEKEPEEFSSSALSASACSAVNRAASSSEASGGLTANRISSMDEILLVSFGSSPSRQVPGVR